MVHWHLEQHFLAGAESLDVYFGQSRWPNHFDATPNQPIERTLSALRAPTPLIGALGVIEDAHPRSAIAVDGQNPMSFEINLGNRSY